MINYVVFIFDIGKCILIFPHRFDNYAEKGDEPCCGCKSNENHFYQRENYEFKYYP